MILQQLKHETRHQHEHIERTLDLPARCQSLADYRALLARFYGFHLPIEAALGRVEGLTDALTDLSARAKARLIAGDLAALGLTAGELAALPRCTDLPDLPDLPQAFGCLYVLEGATLGGQLIARRLAQDLGVIPDLGGTFFNGYGAQTGPMWRAFGASLVAYATTPERETAIITTARMTFTAFERWCS